MREINLSSGEVCLVDDADYDLVNQWKWKGIKSKANVYAGRTTRGKNGKRWGVILMHRLIAGAGDGEQVDHINMSPLDNRRENLRVCSQSQNNANSFGSSNRLSKYKGVSKNGSNWCARTKIDGKQISLGTFKTEEEAARAYDREATKRFGEFARLNFPDSY